ncbi:uncharacterized protein LOC120351292 [Nilaparvata lugens]|uniref:uncharacterized protein LOC120351292 n=1 Tax=Nilaparvata lugens TaxID=108931 RepID=UPI00193E7FCC|nr:uncharacterized protein LOC120351292 [Nilaparvata lugens]
MCTSVITHGWFAHANSIHTYNFGSTLKQRSQHTRRKTDYNSNSLKLRCLPSSVTGRFVTCILLYICHFASNGIRKDDRGESTCFQLFYSSKNHVRLTVRAFRNESLSILCLPGARSMFMAPEISWTFNNVDWEGPRAFVCYQPARILNKLLVLARCLPN